MSEPVQEKWLSQAIHTYKSQWFSWVVIFEAIFGCHDPGHDVLILGISPIKWRQRPDMTIAVDCDHTIKETLEQKKTASALSKTHERSGPCPAYLNTISIHAKISRENFHSWLTYEHVLLTDV